ncbi:MAG: hypothetical protein ACREAE_07905 [Nitrosopumilaceae archaeon]
MIKNIFYKNNQRRMILTPDDTDLTMSSLLLQFGTDPGIVATEYIDLKGLDIDLDVLESKIWEKIHECGVFGDPDYDGRITFDYDGSSLVCTLQIDTPGEFLNLPTVDEVDEVMKKIRKIVLFKTRSYVENVAKNTDNS